MSPSDSGTSFRCRQLRLPFNNRASLHYRQTSPFTATESLSTCSVEERSDITKSPSTYGAVQFACVVSQPSILLDNTSVHYRSLSRMSPCSCGANSPSLRPIRELSTSDMSSHSFQHNLLKEIVLQQEVCGAQPSNANLSQPARRTTRNSNVGLPFSPPRRKKRSSNWILKLQNVAERESSWMQKKTVGCHVTRSPKSAQLDAKMRSRNQMETEEREQLDARTRVRVEGVSWKWKILSYR